MPLPSDRPTRKRDAQNCGAVAAGSWATTKISITRPDAQSENLVDGNAMTVLARTGSTSATLEFRGLRLKTTTVRSSVCVGCKLGKAAAGYVRIHSPPPSQHEEEADRRDDSQVAQDNATHNRTDKQFATSAPRKRTEEHDADTSRPTWFKIPPRRGCCRVSLMLPDEDARPDSAAKLRLIFVQLQLAVAHA